MKLVSCLLLFFLIQMYNTKHSRSSNKIIRIPLKPLQTKSDKKGNGARANIPFADFFAPYVGKITLGEGSNSQTFQVLFDTESEKSWVYSKGFHTCEHNFNILNEKHPKRYVGPYLDSDTTPVLAKHFPGWVYGLLKEDTLTVGNDRGTFELLDVEKAYTGVINQKYDGAVGLQYNSKESNAVSKFCRSIPGGENKFAFYLPKPGNDRGEFTMCGEDKSKYAGSILYQNNVINPGEWAIMLASVQLNGNEALENGIREIDKEIPALVNPSSRMIIGPTTTIRRLYQIVGAKPIPGTDAYTINCEDVSKLPFLQFKSNGYWYSLSGQNYTRPIPNYNKDYCQLMFRQTTERTWTLGEVFIKKYYTVFDMENHRIGFGLAK